jgi:hypothetical protein
MLTFSNCLVFLFIRYFIDSCLLILGKNPELTYVDDVLAFLIGVPLLIFFFNSPADIVVDTLAGVVPFVLAKGALPRALEPDFSRPHDSLWHRNDAALICFGMIFSGMVVWLEGKQSVLAFWIFLLIGIVLAFARTMAGPALISNLPEAPPQVDESQYASLY